MLQWSEAAMIIPFFIPHAGCPHACVFCNQKNITGRKAPVSPEDLTPTIDKYLAMNSGSALVHVAFYGGTFTALSAEIQRAYLQPIQAYIRSGKIRSIRLSTRPDCITSEILNLLRDHHVETIELGAQSMDDRVLMLAGRGHRADDTVRAIDLIKEYGTSLGIQLMPGLPGDSRDGFLSSVSAITALAPDFVRLYPALVIRDTPLATLYTKGCYTPLTLDDAVDLCREALIQFDQSGIPVYRIGLQPSEELMTPGMIIAGPYHPSFGQLVKSSVFLDKMRTILRARTSKDSDVTFQVNDIDLSAAIGQHKSNITLLKQEFGIRNLRIVAKKRLPRIDAPRYCIEPVLPDVGR